MANVASGSSYTHSVMRSCTMEANTSLTSSLGSPPSFMVNEKRRLRSSRVTFSRPQLRHTPTALVDHADWNASRGPTSTTRAETSANAEEEANKSGSNVSRNSHWSVVISSVDKASVVSTLKHCSVSTREISAAPILAFALRASVAAASSERNGRRNSWSTSRSPADLLEEAAGPVATARGVKVRVRAVRTRTRREPSTRFFF